MLTDRRRVEFALPAVIAFNVIAAIVTDPGDEVAAEKAARLRALVLKSCHDPLDGLTAPAAGKMARRIDRNAAEALKAVDNPPADKLGMILFYALESLIETGALELIEGSTFAEAMNLLLPALDQAFAEPALDASARKQAKRLLAHFKTKGFFS